MIPTEGIGNYPDHVQRGSSYDMLQAMYHKLASHALELVQLKHTPLIRGIDQPFEPDAEEAGT